MHRRLLTRTLGADHTTPVRAYAALRAHAAGASSFLLESVVPGERWGRYSILGYRPTTELVYPPHTDVLAELERELGKAGAVASAVSAPNDQGVVARFARALVGYIGYDAVHPLHRVPPWPNAASPARILRGSTVVVFDNFEQTLTIAAPSSDALEQCARDMARGPELAPLSPPDADAAPASVAASMDDVAYERNVERAKEYIRAGDAFQIVLARTFISSRGDADPFDVYRALRVLSPSPYLYFLDLAETAHAEAMAIAGASPETMVRLEAGRMTLRPIAGTRRRGVTAQEDRTLATELLADPKERAEHVMLIDLARNDAGRVCTAGSVELVTNMVVEHYSHVMHIVSEVVGTKRPGVSSIDVVRSAFPAGTLTGAPKVRATEIIRELEAAPRGVYGGAIGYVSEAGDLDLAIAIRTVVCRRDRFEVTAGAGIVEASVPALEAKETRNKARAGLAAIAAAHAAAARGSAGAAT